MSILSSELHELISIVEFQNVHCILDDSFVEVGVRTTSVLFPTILSTMVIKCSSFQLILDERSSLHLPFESNYKPDKVQWSNLTLSIIVLHLM